MELEGYHILSCTLSDQSGAEIGRIRVPVWVFDEVLETEGQFILLSPNSNYSCDDEPTQIPEDLADKIEQFSDHKETEYNIMLIRWSDDHKFAHRVVWTKVAKSAWEECETHIERIVLG